MARRRQAPTETSPARGKRHFFFAIWLRLIQSPENRRVEVRLPKNMPLIDSDQQEIGEQVVRVVERGRDLVLGQLLAVYDLAS